MTRDDVLERNLERLFERAYRPLTARPEFVADLRDRCLATAAGGAEPDPASAAAPVLERPAARRSAWRPALALAAASLVALVGWQVLARVLVGPDRAPGGTQELRAPDLAAILASGRAALRFVDAEDPGATSTDWRAIEAPRTPRARIPLSLAALDAGSALEIATPPVEADDASLWSFDLGLGREPESRLLLAGDSRLVLELSDGGEPVLELAHGRLQLRRPRPVARSTEGAPWRIAGLAGPATSVGLLSGVLDFRQRPGDVCAVALSSEDLFAAPAFAFDAAGRTLPRGQDVELCPGGPSGGRRVTAGVANAREPVAGAARPPVEPAPASAVALRLELYEAGEARPPDGPATVVLHPEVELPPRIDPVTRAVRVIDGRIDLREMPDWVVSVCVLVPERALARLDLRAPLDPGAEGPSVRRVELDSGRVLVGRVVDAATRAPLAGVVVLSETDAPFDHVPYGVEDLPPELAARTVTDADGTFVLGPVRPGEHRVRAVTPGFAPAWRALAAVDPEGARSAALETIGLSSGGAIVGRVEGPDCAPVGGEVVVISSQEIAGGPPYHYGVAVTDALGDYRFPDVAPGDYVVVRAGAQAESSVARPMEILQARVVEGGEARADWSCARERVAVSGRVLDPDGEPVGGCILVLSPKGARPGRDWASTTVDAQGRYTIQGLQAGVYDLLVTSGLPADVVMVGRIELPFEGRHERDVVVGIRRARGRVVALGSEEPAGSCVVLLEQDLDGDYEFMAQKLTAADGSWAVPFLQPGRYRVRVFPLAGVFAASEPAAFAIGDEDPEPMRIELVPGAAFDVRVLDPAGAPVAGARLSGVGGDGRTSLHIGRTGTDGEGRGEVLGLTAGRVRLSVSAAGYRDAEVEIELAPGERHALDVTLERE